MEHTIIKLRQLIEADEKLRQLERSGLFDKLARDVDNVDAWDKVVKTLARYGAKLTFKVNPKIVNSQVEYFVVERAYRTTHARLDFTTDVGTRISWPLKYVTRGALSEKPRKFTFSWSA